MPRTIFHIDMNSYFCSVAAQANPFLRGKAFGVGGKPGTRGIIAAASREAKARGVKTAMNAYEALRICPELEIINGDSSMYEEITNRFLRIFRRYTEDVEVFSIDEAFLDMTGWVTGGIAGDAKRGSPTARNEVSTVGVRSGRTRDVIRMATQIKADMRRELGEAITCSIGVAENKLLAKLGSDLKKPDGLVFVGNFEGRISHVGTCPDIRYSTFHIPDLWPTLPVQDLCGIGPRIGARLFSRFHVETAAQLAALPLHMLIDEFGPTSGYHLFLMGRGEDPSPVVSTVAAAKSYGHSYTLPRDITDRDQLKKVLFTLAERVCRRMRADAACGQTVSIYIRYGDFTGTGQQTRLGVPTNDGLVLFRTGWRLVKYLLGERRGSPLWQEKPVRLLGITCSDISPATNQLSLFSKENKRRFVLTASDRANDKWGERAVEPAAIAGVSLRRHVSGFHHATHVSVQRAGRR